MGNCSIFNYQLQNYQLKMRGVIPRKFKIR